MTTAYCYRPMSTAPPRDVSIEAHLVALGFTRGREPATWPQSLLPTHPDYDTHDDYFPAHAEKWRVEA